MIRDAIARAAAGSAPKPTLSPEQAASRKAALMADKGWAKRYIEGGNAERQEMRDLHHAMAGTRAPSGTPHSIAQNRINALRADPAWRQRYIDGDATARAEATELHHALAASDDNP
jgi:hypothetical protein